MDPGPVHKKACPLGSFVPKGQTFIMEYYRPSRSPSALENATGSSNCNPSNSCA